MTFLASPSYGKGKDTKESGHRDCTVMFRNGPSGVELNFMMIDRKITMMSSKPFWDRQNPAALEYADKSNMRTRAYEYIVEQATKLSCRWEQVGNVFMG